MMVQSIDPWTAVLCGAGSAGILLLIWVLRQFLQPTVHVEPVETLLTAAEQKFYEALDAAIDGRLVILSKVRIADLFIVTSASSVCQVSRLSFDRLQTCGFCSGRGGKPSSHCRH